MKPVSVLLVDDHAVVRAGYRMLLEQTQYIQIAGEADSGEAACQRYAELSPHLVIMDLSMPGMGGLNAIRRICARDATARIIAFSIHDEAIYAERALEAGAMGYISKSCAPELLLAAVECVANGERYIEPAIQARMRQSESGSSATTALLQQLTTREFDIFCLLARGLTTREIAEKLNLSYKTVANYHTLIKTKLGIHTSAEMAHIALDAGLID